ncbi:MAG: hypothetical protein OCD02_21515 [Spirochaetaceae bacterium]
MKNRFLFILIILSTSFLYSIDLDIQEKPLWVQFEEAKSLYQNGEFQEALDFFLEVTKNPRPFPEAEYMIGLLYLEEGELEIAEEQILKALGYSNYLQVPQDLMKYKYTLSNIYLLKDDYDGYVYTLKDIIGQDEIDLQEVRDDKAYYDTLLESGLDRLLHLYRKDANNVVNARINLGYYYNSIGEYKKAVNYLLSPTIALITEVINDNILNDREYVFQSMTLFFSEVKNSDRARNYFIEHGFYRLFYYLAESLYGIGEDDTAQEIWILLKDSGVKSKWITKAKRQILVPTLEKWKFIY